MNRIKYIVMCAILLGCFTSCKKESLLTYDTADNIYFNFKASGGVSTDSADVSFAFRIDAIKDSTFKLPLAITGAPADHDRTYKLVVVENSTTAISGQHYSLPTSFTIRAGRVIDSLRIKLNRTADLQTKGVVLNFRLEEGNDFQTNIKVINTLIGGNINALTFKMKISDILTESTRWAANFLPYFGTFSVKKLRLINQITGMPLDYTETYIFDLTSTAKRTVYAITMSQYLKDQKTAGNTIFEDNGTEMKMAAAYQ